MKMIVRIIQVITNDDNDTNEDCKIMTIAKWYHEDDHHFNNNGHDHNHDDSQNDDTDDDDDDNGSYTDSCWCAPSHLHDTIPFVIFPGHWRERKAMKDKRTHYHAVDKS